MADPVADILRKQPIPDAVRAQAWDAFESAKDADDLASKLQAIKMPDAAKASLWDLKSQAVPEPVPVPDAPEPAAATPPTDQRSWLAKQFDSVVGAPGATEVAKGAAKSVLGAVEGGGKLIRAIPGIGNLLAKGPEVTLPVSTTPTNDAQAIGKTAGDIGMFFAPAGLVGKGKAALATGRGVLDGLLGAGLEGASAAGVTGLQTGDMGSAATAGGVTAAVTGGLSAAKPAAKWLGERIEKALVKPQKADTADGFSIGKVFQYDLGGTLRQTYDKTDAAIKDRMAQLKQVLRASPAKVDVLDALSETQQRLRQAAEHQGSGLSYPEMERSLNTILEKILPVVQGAGGDPKVDLAVANAVKQVAGDIGAFTHGFTGKVQWGEDAGALEQAANTLYDVLKGRIEQGAIGPVKAINKQIGDIIGVRRAVIRRIPVAERQNMISLIDAGAAMKGGPTGLALWVANHALRSGTVANALVKGSQSNAPAAIGRTVGAVTGAAQ